MFKLNHLSFLFISIALLLGCNSISDEASKGTTADGNISPEQFGEKNKELIDNPTNKSYQEFDYENGYVQFTSKTNNQKWHLRGEMKVSHFGNSIIVKMEGNHSFIIPFESLIYAGSYEIN